MTNLTLVTLATVKRLAVPVANTNIMAPDYTSATLASCRTALLAIYTTHGIATKWDQCTGLHKRPASDSTIDRWMRKGPVTKNVNFETWLMELAKLEGWVPPVAKVLTLSEQLKFLELNIDNISGNVEAATVMGITGFANELRRRNALVIYSSRQADIIRTMFHRYNVG